MSRALIIRNVFIVKRMLLPISVDVLSVIGELNIFV